MIHLKRSHWSINFRLPFDILIYETINGSLFHGWVNFRSSVWYTHLTNCYWILKCYESQGRQWTQSYYNNFELNFSILKNKYKHWSTKQYTTNKDWAWWSRRKKKIGRKWSLEKNYRPILRVANQRIYIYIESTVRLIYFGPSVKLAAFINKYTLF
jgi:hypothetical protein